MLLNIYFAFLETESHSLGKPLTYHFVEAGLQLPIFLTLPPECWYTNYPPITPSYCFSVLRVESLQCL